VAIRGLNPRKRLKAKDLAVDRSVHIASSALPSKVLRARRASGINLLIEVDPENAGEEGDGRGEWQKDDDGPDYISGDPPTCRRPKEKREERNEQYAQGVADVHGAEEVAWFALEMEMADGALFVHFGEAEEDGMVKDFSDAAARAALAKNIDERGACGGLHGSVQCNAMQAFAAEPRETNSKWNGDEGRAENRSNVLRAADRVLAKREYRRDALQENCNQELEIQDLIWLVAASQVTAARRK